MSDHELLDVPDWLDLVHESIVVRDPGGCVRWWNQSSERLYGWPRETALGRRTEELLHCEYPVPFPDIEARLLGDGNWEGEIRRRHADGSERVIDVSLTLRRSADGGVLGMIETGRDITERRRAEAALQRSEHRYRNMFEAMAASFWELDFAGVGAMLRELRKSGVTDYGAYFAEHPGFVRQMMHATLVVDVNEQSVQLFGRGNKQEILGASVEPFWPDASSEVFAASVLAAVSGRPRYASNTKLRTLDGQEIDVLFTACFAPDAVGRAQLLIGVIDLSEQVRARAETQRLQSELAHATRVSVLGELTASIAHEVNQPLAAIATNGAAGLRWLGRAEPDVAEARTLLQRMVDDARRAADIIARIRAMATRKPTTPVALAINAVIDETVLFLQHELRAQDVMLDLDLAPQLPAVHADRVQLQQVLVNLLVNAAQAMAQAGSVQRVLHVQTAQIGDVLQISVADNGPGIAVDHLPKLFDSFFTTKANGMGLGLPVCRSIIEAHGGTLVGANRAEGGACFTFTLPVPTQAAV